MHHTHTPTTAEKLIGQAVKTIAGRWIVITAITPAAVYYGHNQWVHPSKVQWDTLQPSGQRRT